MNNRSASHGRALSAVLYKGLTVVGSTVVGSCAVALSVGVMAALALAATGAAHAAAPDLVGGTDAGDATGERPAVHRDGLADHGWPVWVSHHGMFRFRPELLLNGDLGEGQSPIPDPLGVDGPDPDADLLSWASIRLRYQPVFHIGPSVSIHLGVDALNNLVLGSTHVNAGGDVSVNFFDDRQAPPSAGINGFSDAVQVRELWGRWVAFDMLDLRLGRMANEFGLGLYRNDGDCRDCDFGTVIDQARLALSVGGFRLEASWEFTATGATTSDGAPGQPKDLGQDDDVSTYTVQAGQRPVSPAELEARRRLLDEERGWGVDWAIFSAFTDQELSSLEQREDTSLDCRPQEVLGNGQPVLPVDCVRLFQREAFFWRPGVWVRAEHRPDWDTRLRLELELAGLVGDIAHPQRLDEPDDQEAKDFVGFGGALEVELWTGRIGLGLDAGFATGDDGEFLGVLDGQNIVEPDDDAYANSPIRDNRDVTSYWFNRDYRLDLILFRQILGTVTNAVYVKPWVATEILRMESAVLSARLDVLYAAAANPAGTPGDGQHWGVEIDGRLGLTTTDGFDTTLALGVLFPLDALDNRDTGDSPSPAFSAMLLTTWSF